MASQKIMHFWQYSFYILGLFEAFTLPICRQVMNIAEFNMLSRETE